MVDVRLPIALITGVILQTNALAAFAVEPSSSDELAWHTTGLATVGPIAPADVCALPTRLARSLISVDPIPTVPQDSYPLSVQTTCLSAESE